jgi:hypothetical protein
MEETAHMRTWGLEPAALVGAISMGTETTSAMMRDWAKSSINVYTANKSKKPKPKKYTDAIAQLEKIMNEARARKAIEKDANKLSAYKQIYSDSREALEEHNNANPNTKVAIK